MEQKITHVTEMFDNERKCLVDGVYLNCSFYHCDLLEINNCYFSGCSFTSCNFIEISNNSNFHNCNFERPYVTKVDKAYFTHCYFESVSMPKSEIFYADVQKCTFTNSLTISKTKIDALIFFDNIFERKMELNVFDLETPNPDAIFRENNTIDFTHLPTEAFIGYKAVEYSTTKTENGKDYAILAVQIPAYAQRVCATGYKARADQVRVLEAEDVEGHPLPIDITYYSGFYGAAYRFGETVHADKFDPNPLQGCTNGIHFFLDKQDAIDYVIH